MEKLRLRGKGLTTVQASQRGSIPKEEFQQARPFPWRQGLNWLLNLESRFSCPVVFLIYWRPVENILESHKNDER